MSRPKIAFLFSGQGSQYFDMGRELYEGNSVFRYWMDRLDMECQKLQRTSVVDLLYSSGYRRSDTFDQLQHSHPAIFILEYSLFQALKEAGVRPDIVVASSLGFFAATAVVGVLDVKDALASVIQHARNVELTCEAGCMIAVLAPVVTFTASGLSKHSELAAVNTDSHFVLSALASERAKIEEILKKNDLIYQVLPVNFAFHSRWIERSAGFSDWCRKLSFQLPQLPLLCCAQVRYLKSISTEDIWYLTRMPIRFRDAIQYLDSLDSWQYIDAGPSGTLATLMRYISPTAVRESRIHRILSPLGGGHEALSKIAALLGTRTTF